MLITMIQCRMFDIYHLLNSFFFHEIGNQFLKLQYYKIYISYIYKKIKIDYKILKKKINKHDHIET